MDKYNDMKNKHLLFLFLKKKNYYGVIKFIIHEVRIVNILQKQ